jgi:biopolymer transport protein ExbB
MKSYVAAVKTTLCLLAILSVWSSVSSAQVNASPASSTKTIEDAMNPAEDATAPAASSYVGWIVRSSGLIGLFILLLTVYFLVSVTRLSFDLRQQTAAPPEQVVEIEHLIQNRELKKVYELVRAGDSYLTRVFSKGLSELPNGLAEARLNMECHGEAEVVAMESRISTLAVLGSLGPMIGLIGTLKGMIASFSVIAVSGAQLRANEIAGGISEALLLTFEGVALSIPAIYFYSVFRNRVSSISVATMLTADGLLRQFAHAARLRATPAAPVTTLNAGHSSAA